MTLTTSTYAVAVGYYSIVTVSCLVFFGCVRRSRAFRKFYSPRCYSTDPRFKRPPELPFSWFIAWVVPAASFNQLTIYEFSGIDGLVMLRTLYFSLQLVCVMTVLCCAVLLPINLTGGQVAVMESDPGNVLMLSSLDKMSMTNIAPHSNRLYAHAIISYVITAVATTMLWHYNKVFIALRMLHLGNQRMGEEAYSVLVQDVPGIVAGTKVQRLGTGWMGLCCVPANQRRARAEAAFRATQRLAEGVRRAGFAVNHGTWRAVMALLRGMQRAGNAMLRLLGRDPGDDAEFAAAAVELHLATLPASSVTAAPVGSADADLGAAMFDKQETTAAGGAHGAQDTSLDAEAQLQAHPTSAAAAGSCSPEEASAGNMPGKPAGGSTKAAATTTTGHLRRRRHRSDATVAAGEAAGKLPFRSSVLYRVLQSRFDLDLFTDMSAWRRADGMMQDGMTPQQMVMEEFSSIYGQDVAAAHLTFDTRELEPLVKRYKRLARSLLDNLDAMAARLRRGKQVILKQIRINPAHYGAWAVEKYGQAASSAAATGEQGDGTAVTTTAAGGKEGDSTAVTTTAAAISGSSRSCWSCGSRCGALSSCCGGTCGGCGGCCGGTCGGCGGCGRCGYVSVTALEFKAALLEQLRERILQKQAEAKGLPAPAAIVSFKSRRSQVVAASSLMHHDTSSWVVRTAPPPGDLLWAALRLRQWERGVRRLGVYCLYLVLALTYVFPVNLVQSMLSAESWIEWMGSHPAVGAIYLAFLPGLALKIFVWTLPLWLALIQSLEGRVSKLEADLALMTAFYAFQVVVVLFGSFVGGAWLVQLRALLDEGVATMVDVLGSSAPQSSLFFLNYVTLQALVTTPLFFLRLPQFMVYGSRVMLSYTHRAKERIWQSRNINYGANIAWITFSVNLAVVYSPVLPIMAPVALLWLCIVTTLWKYDLVYVFKQAVSGGGKMWRHVFWHMVVALLGQHLILAAIIGIKLNIGAACMMIVPPVYTIIFAVIVNRRFNKPAWTLSLRAAADVDAALGSGAHSTLMRARSGMDSGRSSRASSRSCSQPQTPLGGGGSREGSPRKPSVLAPSWVVPGKREWPLCGGADPAGGRQEGESGAAHMSAPKAMQMASDEGAPGQIPGSGNDVGSSPGKSEPRRWDAADEAVGVKGEALAIEDDDDEVSTQDYVNPVLRFDEARHRMLMEEAAFFLECADQASGEVQLDPQELSMRFGTDADLEDLIHFRQRGAAPGGNGSSGSTELPVHSSRAAQPSASPRAPPASSPCMSAGGARPQAQVQGCDGPSSEAGAMDGSAHLLTPETRVELSCGSGRAVDGRGSGSPSVGARRASAEQPMQRQASVLLVAVDDAAAGPSSGGGRRAVGAPGGISSRSSSMLRAHAPDKPVPQDQGSGSGAGG